jgi:predicted HTH transcriptional regulator
VIPTVLSRITINDFQNLVVNQVREGKTIDYKRDLIGNNDASKKEFLADVSSFANTIGGDLIIGIEEAAGVPAAINGVSPPDMDKEIQRLT